MASKPVLERNWPNSSGGRVPESPVSSTRKPGLFGSKYRPRTVIVSLAREILISKISGGRGVGVFVGVAGAVGEGVTGVEVAVWVGVGGLNGR